MIMRPIKMIFGNYKFRGKKGRNKMSTDGLGNSLKWTV